MDIKHKNILTDTSGEGNKIPPLPDRKGVSIKTEFSVTGQRKRARIHPAGWSGEQHLSSSSMGRQTPAAEHRAELTSLWDFETLRKLSVAGFVNVLWLILHPGFFVLPSVLGKWNVMERRYAPSFPPAQSTMCVSLTVPALCHQPSFPLPHFIIIWQTHPVTSA